MTTWTATATREARDCEDDDADVNPGVPEIPYDGVDDDCDPSTPDDDLDRDGTLRADDCDDEDALVGPGVPEVPYNGVDDDCDERTPDDDLDGDGFVLDVDCDDMDPARSPGLSERPYNGVDDDCDELTPDDDLDADGYPLARDCDDTDPSVHPGAVERSYDGVDDDCDELTLDDDLDSDGFPLAEECDDDDPTVYPGAPELCDGIDQDCDGLADEDILGDAAECPAASCLEILDLRPDLVDGTFYVDSGAGVVSVECDMSTDGGGWTQLRETYRAGLAGGVERQYLYTEGGAWYLSPVTTTAWSWGGYAALNGSYSYSYGGDDADGSFACTSREGGHFGVGCSNGPGGTFKVLPIYTISSTDLGTCTICQDQPDAFSSGACQGGVQIWSRP
ncbi:MAG: hypothetical protein ACI8PZ_005063 [Myxococcota bacterium]|jgi:hypothetical protein